MLTISGYIPIKQFLDDILGKVTKLGSVWIDFYFDLPQINLLMHYGFWLGHCGISILIKKLRFDGKVVHHKYLPNMVNQIFLLSLHKKERKKENSSLQMPSWWTKQFFPLQQKSSAQ